MDCIRNFRSLIWTHNIRKSQQNDCFDFRSCSCFHLHFDPQDLLHYENWETILFIFGMMTVIKTKSLSVFFYFRSRVPQTSFH